MCDTDVPAPQNNFGYRFATESRFWVTTYGVYYCYGLYFIKLERTYVRVEVVQPGMINKTLRFIYEAGKTILVALLIVVPLRLYVAQPFFVRGASMEPTFTNGDYLIVDEISYRFNGPERGDVVVFRFPGDPSQFFIKRIIGLPGDTVEGVDGGINITSGGETFVIEEPYIKVTTPDDFKIITGPNEYVVLGDNRGASSDSRRWGILPADNIIGQVFATVWPPEDFSVFAAPAY